MTKKNSQRLEHGLLVKIHRTLRQVGLAHESLRLSGDELQRRYENLCTPVGETRVFDAFINSQDFLGKTATFTQLRQNLSEKEIRYAVAWEMLKAEPEKTLRFTKFAWATRQERTYGSRGPSGCPRELTGMVDFIKESFSDNPGTKEVGLIPLAEALRRVRLSRKWDAYTEADFKQELVRNRFLHRVELVPTKSGTAENLEIELVEINGIKYGFIKIDEQQRLQAIWDKQEKENESSVIY